MQLVAVSVTWIAVVVLGGSSKRNFDTLFEDNGAVALSSDSDEMDCGEGVDVADLCLGGVQEELLQAVLATGTPTVVVLIQGRPHSIPWIAEHCPAVLCAWYPGQFGGTAVAEALFGVINPSGWLSISIPRSSAQLPVYYNHKTKGDSRYRDMEGTALYPFGYGLSYTNFTFANLQIDTTATVRAIEAGASVAVAVDVTNSGACAGAEVVQLYIHGCGSSITRRVKELKAFDKVMLQPGETRTVHFILDKAALGVWNPAMQFVVESGRVEVLLGGGCGTALTGAVTLIP